MLYSDQHPQKWNRHTILAEIKVRYGSLGAFAATTPLEIGHFSVALARPYPRADQYIANALGLDLHELWPDRYDSRGRRRTQLSRRRLRETSQNRRRAS